MVALIEKLRADAFKTGADAAKAGGLPGAPAGAIKSLLRDIFSVKSSAVVNHDGAPFRQLVRVPGDERAIVFGGGQPNAACEWFGDDVDLAI